MTTAAEDKKFYDLIIKTRLVKRPIPAGPDDICDWAILKKPYKKLCHNWTNFLVFSMKKSGTG